MNLLAGIFAQRMSVPPAGRIWRKTSCWSGFTCDSPARARSERRRSRLSVPAGRSRPWDSVIVKVWTSAQQAGSSKSVSPLPSSSMQFPQISCGAGSVVVVVEVGPPYVVVVEDDVDAVVELVVGSVMIEVDVVVDWVVELVVEAVVDVVVVDGAVVDVVVVGGAVVAVVVVEGAVVDVVVVDGAVVDVVVDGIVVL